MLTGKYGDLFCRGFATGDHANAYKSEDFGKAWTLSEESRFHDEDQVGTHGSAEYRAGFVLGFFSAYETSEIPLSCRDEYAQALSDYREEVEALAKRGFVRRNRSSAEFWRVHALDERA